MTFHLNAFASSSLARCQSRWPSRSPPPPLTYRPLGPDLLDHDPDGILKPARIMRRVLGQQEHLAFPYGDIPLLAVIDHLEQHGALVLVKPLLGLVDVVVAARVGSTDDHDGERRARVDAMVADGRLEEVRVGGEPLGEIDWRGEHGGAGHVDRGRNGRSEAK